MKTLFIALLLVLLAIPALTFFVDLFVLPIKNFIKKLKAKEISYFKAIQLTCSFLGFPTIATGLIFLKRDFGPYIFILGFIFLLISFNIHLLKDWKERYIKYKNQNQTVVI